MPEQYKISHLPRGSTPKEALMSTPIPGESRVPVSRRGFPDFASELEKTAEVLGGRAVVFLNTAEPFNYSSAIVSWRDIKPDNLGSRFVKMGKLDIFEVETPVTRFLLEALESGAHLKKPKYYTAQGWDRLIDIVVINFLGKEARDDALGKMFTQEQIGVIYPIKKVFPKKAPLTTREHIRQRVSKAIEIIHFNSSDYLKQRYPLEQLLDQIERSRFMVDEIGKTRAVAAAILQGATDQDLIKAYRLASDLFYPRIILSGYGLKVPPRPEHDKYRLLTDDLRAIKADDPPIKKQQVLNRIDRGYLVNNGEEYKTFCLSVFSLAEMASLHYTGQFGGRNLILQALSEAGINTRSISHEVKSGKQKGVKYTRIILAVDKDQALAILKQDPNLESLRREVVWQICGEKVDQLPTTGQLQKSEEYKSVSSLLRQLGLKYSGPHFSMKSLLIGCPVPMFKMRSSHYYHINSQQQLLEFLKINLQLTNN